MIGCTILYSKRIRGMYTKCLYTTLKTIFSRKSIVVNNRGPNLCTFCRSCINLNNIVFSAEGRKELSIPNRLSSSVSWNLPEYDGPDALEFPKKILSIKPDESIQKTFSSSVYEKFLEVEGDFTNVISLSYTNSRGCLIFADKLGKLRFYLLEGNGFYVLLWSTLEEKNINNILSHLGCDYYLIHQSDEPYVLTVKIKYLADKWKRWVNSVIASGDKPKGNMHTILGNYIKGRVKNESRVEEP